MNEYELKKIYNDKAYCQQRYEEFLNQQVLRETSPDPYLVQGHMQKSRHNLSFTFAQLETEFQDWAVTGAYYAMYHAALALLASKGVSTKSHNATLYALVKHFTLPKKHLTHLSTAYLTYQELLLYAGAKNAREKATYETQIEQTNAKQLHLQAAAFVSAAQELL